MVSDGGAELGQDDGPGDAVVDGDSQREPGVVIEPGQDLGAGAVSEGIVRNCMIALTTPSGTARGEVFGRRGRRSNAVSPSAR